MSPMLREWMSELSKKRKSDRMYERRKNEFWERTRDIEKLTNEEFQERKRECYHGGVEEKENEGHTERAGIYDQCFWTVIVLYLNWNAAVGYDLC